MTAKEWRDESRKYQEKYPDSYLVYYPDFRRRDDVVEMSQRDFDRLDEYSTSIPTGTFLGKCWKARKLTNANDANTEYWMLCWYGWPDWEGAVPGKDVKINHMPIRVVTDAQRIVRDELERLEREDGQKAA